MADKVVAMGPRGRGRSRKPAGEHGGRGPAPDVLQLLRDRIARQEIPPGARLRESQLAEEFGAPRTRIREAFSALEQRGLIERIPNRGAVVTRLDPSHVFHIYDVREVLEGLCARLAAENTPPESWQDLVDLFAGPMEECVRQGDFDAFVAGYERFRRRTIEAAGNPVLAQMLDSIYEKTEVLIRRIIILPGRAEVGLRQHRHVLAAMRRGDAQEAERARRENMRSAKEFLRRYQKYVL
jgi:DNA-binding GntR family transcriptional regulator